MEIEGLLQEEVTFHEAILMLSCGLVNLGDAREL